MPATVSKQELLAMVGALSEPSAWLRVEQSRIDAFAAATEDRQWIHVDAGRAAAGPFGATVAHGYLTLSLLPHLLREVTVRPTGTRMAINYGLDKLRFLEPVTAGSSIRARARILEAREKAPDRLLVATEATVEIEGREKPALVAETLTLFVLGRG